MFFKKMEDKKMFKFKWVLGDFRTFKNYVYWARVLIGEGELDTGEEGSIQRAIAKIYLKDYCDCPDNRFFVGEGLMDDVLHDYEIDYSYSFGMYVYKFKLSKEEIKDLYNLLYEQKTKTNGMTVHETIMQDEIEKMRLEMHDLIFK